MICGVAIGLAERYGARVWLVRTVIVTAFLASPIAVLVYLLLALSIPSERNVAGHLRLVTSAQARYPHERFELLSRLLVARLLGKDSKFSAPSPVFGFVLFVLAGVLELRHLGGSAFFTMHSIGAGVSDDFSEIGTPLLYLSLASLFLWGQSKLPSQVVMSIPDRDRFTLEHGSGKMIGGVVSGIAPVLELDSAYLRAALIIVNILTLGLAGAAYLLIWYLQRAKPYSTAPHGLFDSSDSSDKRSPAFRFAVASVFLILALIDISTNRHLFFFNQTFVQGLVMTIFGIALVWHGAKALRDHSALHLIGGASIFFFGFYELVSSTAHLQVSIPNSFEVSEIIFALSILYYAVISLRGHSRTLAIWIAGMFALSALLIAIHVTPPIYLIELVRFYGFFYPLIFAGLGLWITFER